MNSIEKETEKKNVTRDWKIYIIVSTVFILCVLGVSFFEPKFDFNLMVQRLFDALISCVLIVNGMYFLQKNKGIAYVSLFLGIINLGILGTLLLK